MKVGIIVLFISFMLDGLLSILLPYQLNDITIFKPMFTIVSFILIYPYFNKDDHQFYKVTTIYGMFYDIVYTNTFPLNTLLFFLLALTVSFIHNILSSNIVNMMIMTILTITIFEFLNYFFLNIIDYTSITFYEIIYKISHSLLINIIYVLISYLILNKISKKYKIKRID